MAERLDHLRSLLAELWSALAAGAGALELDSTVQGLSEIVAGLDILSADTDLSAVGANASGPKEEAKQVCDILLTATSDGKPIDVVSWIDNSRPSGLGGASDAKAKEIGKAREGVLYLLSNLILIGEDAILPYAARIRRVCLRLMDTESSSPVAKALLAPLRRLAELRLQSADEFKPREVYDKLVEAYRATGSIYHKQPTPKGEVLAMMGLIVDTCPAQFVEKDIDVCFSRLMSELDKEWRDAADLGGAKGSEHLPVIAGALEGVSALLRSHSDVITRAPGAPAKLVRYIVKGIHMGHGSFGRRLAMEVPVACHKLLIHHTLLLAPQLLPTSRELFDALLWNSHLKARKAIRAELAPAALIALLQQVALSLSRSRTADGGKADFDWFIGRLSTMMAGQHAFQTTLDANAAGRTTASDGPILPEGVAYSSWTDLLLAVQGCGIFAQPIASRLGSQKLRDVAITLMSRVMTLLGEDAGAYRSSAARTGSEFAASAAAMEAPPIGVAEDDDEDEDDDDNLERGPRTTGGGGVFLSTGRRRATILSTTLSSVASILQQMPPHMIDDSILSPVQTLAEQLIYAFPSLASGANGGRAEVCRSVLSMLMALATVDAAQAASNEGHSSSSSSSSSSTISTTGSLLSDLCARVFPGAFFRTLTRTSDWTNGLISGPQGMVGGGGMAEPASDAATSYGAPSAQAAEALVHTHPVTGLPESRLLFEYIPFWRELLSPEDDTTKAALKAFAKVGAARLQSAAGGGAGAGASSESSSSAAAAAAFAPNAALAGSEPYTYVSQQFDDGGPVEDEDMGTGAGGGRKRKRASAPVPIDTASVLRDCLGGVRSSVFASLMGSAVEFIQTAELGLVKTEVSRGGVTRSSVEGDASLLALGSQDIQSAFSQAGGGGTADDAAAAVVEPVNHLDFDRFLTLVDLFRYGLPLFPHQPLLGWAHTLVRCCIRGAARYPHVSGYYTILTVLMAVAQELRWFEAASPSTLPGDLSSSSGLHLSDVPPSTRDTFALIDAFATEVFARSVQYKGELLLSSLQFLLLLPHRLLCTRTERTISALTAVLSGGVSQPALASLGISSLSRLYVILPEFIKPALPRLLPLLGSILEQGQQRSDADAAAASISVSAAGEDEDDEALVDETQVAVTSEGDNEVSSSAKMAELLRAQPKEAKLNSILAAVATAGARLGSSDALSGREGRNQDLLVLYSSRIVAMLAASAAGADDDFSQLATSMTSPPGGAPPDPLQDDETDGLTSGRGPLAILKGPSRAIFASVTLADVDFSASSLCMRVALLLGRLGGEARHIVGELKDHLKEELEWGAVLSTSGDIADALTVQLQLEEGGRAVDVPVDVILPRAVTLALTATTRQTKVAACELVHASMLLIIGNMFVKAGPAPQQADVSGALPKSKYYGLLSKLFPVCLQLAVDADAFPRQLFSLLCKQLAHQFGEHDNRPEATLLIDCVMDALASKEASLRDFAALMLAEFVDFTIRTKDDRSLVEGAGLTLLAAPGASQPASRMASSLQGSQDPTTTTTTTTSSSSSRASRHQPTNNAAARGSRQGPLAVDTFFRRIFAAARHSSPYHRLGAALAWNAVYRKARESHALRYRYMYAIVDHMVQALRASAHDASNTIGTAAAAGEALVHCERILTHLAGNREFMVADEQERFSSSRPQQSPRTMNELIAWLFLRCGLPETQVRRKCMQLFDALAPKVVAHSSASSSSHGGRSIGGRGALTAHPSGKDVNAATSWQLELARTWVSGFTSNSGAAAKGYHLATSSRAVGAGSSSDADGEVDGDASASGGGPSEETNLSSISPLLSLITPGGGNSSLIALAESCVTVMLKERGGMLSSAPIPSAGGCTLIELTEWTDRLAASLDIYVWMLRREYLPSSALAPSSGGSGAGPGKGRHGNSSSASGAHILPWLKSYLGQFGTLSSTSRSASSSSSDLAQWVTDAADATPVAIARLKRTRAIFICRLTAFVCALLRGFMKAPDSNATASSSSSTTADAALPTAELSLLQEHGILSPSALQLCVLAMVAPTAMAVEDEDTAAVSGTSGAGMYVSQATGRMLLILCRAGDEMTSALADAITAAIEGFTACKDLIDLPAMLSGLGRRAGSSSSSSSASLAGHAVTFLQHSVVNEVEALLRLAALLNECGLLGCVLSSGIPSAAAGYHSDDGGSSGSESEGRRSSRKGKRQRRDASHATSSAGSADVVASFSSRLGTAAYNLPESASPEQLHLAGGFIDLAMTVGWRWKRGDAGSSGGDGSMSLSQCLALDGLPAAANISAAKRFYNRFSRRVLRCMLRADVYTSMDRGVGAGAGSENSSSSSTSGGDARTRLSSYPVLSDVIASLIATTTSAGSAIADDGTGSAAAPAARDFAWRLLTDIVRVMARTSASARLRVEMEVQAMAAASSSAAAEDGAAASSSSSSSGDRKSSDKGEASSSGKRSGTGSSSGAATDILGTKPAAARIRTSVFVNSLVAALPYLTPWTEANAADDHAQWLLFLLRALAAFDPWLLIADASEETSGAGSSGSSLSRQVRALPEAAVAVVQAALTRCTVTSYLGEAAAVSARLNDMHLQLVSMLPLLLPGYAADHLLPASTVSIAAMWPGLERKHPQLAFGRRGMNAVYGTALQLVHAVMEKTFPLWSREFSGSRLAQLRRLLALLLSAFAITGSLPLLQQLHRVLREGPQHVSYVDVVASLNALASRIAPSGPSPVTVLAEVLASSLLHLEPTGLPAHTDRPVTITQSQMAHPEVGRLLVERLVTPLIQRMGVEEVRRIFTGSGFIAEVCAVARELSGQSALPNPLHGWRSNGMMLGEPSPSLVHYLLNCITYAAASKGGAFDSASSGTDKWRLQHFTTCLQLMTVFYETQPRSYFTADKGKNSTFDSFVLGGFPASAMTRAEDYNSIKQMRVNGMLALRCRVLITEVSPSTCDASGANSFESELLMFRQAAFGCMSSALRKTQQAAHSLYGTVFGPALSQADLLSRLTNTSTDTIQLRQQDGTQIGGMPFLTDTTYFKRVQADLDKFVASAPVPAALAASRALATMTQSAAASIMGSAAGASASGMGAPLSQALSLSQAPITDDLDSSYGDDEAIGSGAAAAGAGTGGGVRVERSLGSLLAEGDAMAYSSSLAETSAAGDATSGDEDELAAEPESSLDAQLHAEQQAQSALTQKIDKSAATRGPRAEAIVPKAQEVELDYFNSNPAMLPLLRVIDYILALHEAEKDEAASADGAAGAALLIDKEPAAKWVLDNRGVLMPEWVAVFYLRLENKRTVQLVKEGKVVTGVKDIPHSTPLPTRMFLIKTILNRPKAFQPWQAQFTPLIMTALLEVKELAEQQANQGKQPCISCEPVRRKDNTVLMQTRTFHYLLRDCCLLLCHYWPEPTAEEIAAAAALSSGAGAGAGAGSSSSSSSSSSAAASDVSRPFVPSTDEERQLCASFLTYLMDCSPSRSGYLRNTNLSFVGVLISRWAPLGVRPAFTTLVQSMLMLKDTSSRTALSNDGARVAVGVATLFFLVTANQLPFIEGVDAPVDSKLQRKTFYGKIILGIDSAGMGFSQKPLVTCTLFAELVGLILRKASELQAAGSRSGALTPCAGWRGSFPRWCMTNCRCCIKMRTAQWRALPSAASSVSSPAPWLWRGSTLLSSTRALLRRRLPPCGRHEGGCT